MKNKVLMLCGILAPVIYIFTVVLGGAIRPGYSHVAQAVSDLIATEAPNKALLDSLFALYNLLTIAFGVGLFLYVRSSNQKRGNLVGTLGALILGASAVFGVIILFFPEPVGGMAAPITSTGTMHIVFAGLSSLSTMLAMLLMGFWFRNNPRLQRYGLYSFISVAVVFLSGGLAAVSVANQSPIAGLLERITIGGFIQWLFVIAAMLYSSEVTLALPNRLASSS
jgi:hypothetical membrane protein